MTAFFKGVSDPSRVKIMMLLNDGEMTVSEIVSHFEMTQPSISHHLSVLRNAGIVQSRKEGKEIYYSLDLCCVTDCCSGFRLKFEK